MGTVRGPLKVKNYTIKIKGDMKEEGSHHLVHLYFLFSYIFGI